MPGFMDWFIGTEAKVKKKPTMDPQQQKFFSQMLSMLGGQGGGYQQGMDYFKSLLDPSSQASQAFAAPYMQQFEQETVPMLAEKFAGQGALSSSGFGQSLSSAGSNLQTQLAALRAQLAGQGAQSMMQQGQFALSKDPFAYMTQDASAGVLGPMLIALAQGMGGAARGGM